jgi:carbon-monoxide dehydrogenase medium subunit
MKSAPFEYIRPRSVAEASAALAQAGVAASAVAGGQSLIPMLSLRVALVDLLVDISRLEELKTVSETLNGLAIGALTTHAAIEDGKVPDLFGGLLRRVAGQISYRAVRNYGTIGGSVAFADPAADWPPCLVALDARVRISGPKGGRSEAIADFMRGAYSTSLSAGEIILGFDIPRPGAPLRWGFSKVARKSGAFADSIALATSAGAQTSVVLGGAPLHARFLPAASKQVAAGNGSEDALRAAIARDLDAIAPTADAYQRRLHTANILKAVREMRAQ